METNPTDKAPVRPIPKRSCMINIMFAIDNDTKALELKGIIDKAIADIPEKRYTFQINEN